MHIYTAFIIKSNQMPPNVQIIQKLDELVLAIKALAAGKTTL